jgi:hypothetical protein
MCRTRRIKCDEAKPTCNQCIKSRRQCPGYKDEFDLVFRNETQATKRRAQKANRKALEKLGKLPPNSDDDSLTPIRISTHAVVPSLNIPLQEQATCHFVSNFVLVTQQAGCSGFLDFVPQLLGQDLPSKPLSHAFLACAMGALGNRVNQGDSGLSSRALSEYTKALKAVGMALNDPVESRTDATLAAILLLGLYENITARDFGSMAWGTHTQGAIQIVKNRGKELLRTTTGMQLFIAVRVQMVVQTTSTGTAPIYGTEWWLKDAVSNKVAAENQRLNIRTAELRAEVTRMMATLSRTPENIEVMLDMIRRAQMIDQECVNWMNSTPPHWAFKAVTWEDNVPGGDYSRAEVYPGRVDMYPDFWISSVWNMARVSRVILASVIVRCAAWVCAPVDYRTTPEYATAARTVVESITDILASVPFHLGWHVKKKEVLAKVDISGFACGHEEVQKMLSGYFLTWPLACIYGQDYMTDNQRAYVRGRLNYIADEVGIKYAHLLSKLNVRLPSMLIRRDGLMAAPYPMAHNFEKLLSAKYATSPVSLPIHTVQQRESLQRDLHALHESLRIGHGPAGGVGEAQKKAEEIFNQSES